MHVLAHRGRANRRVSGAEAKRRREALGLTVEALAFLLDVTRQSVYNWESPGPARKQLSRQTALLLLMLEYPEGRALLTHIRQAQDALCQEALCDEP